MVLLSCGIGISYKMIHKLNMSKNILITAMSHMHEKYNITGCAVAGDALAGVKMQGGTISWNCDTDFQSFHGDRETLFEHVYPGKIKN